MKLSLPLRVFLYHLALMVALGALTTLAIRHGFKRYAEDWETSLRTLTPEQLFTPLATEVARSLLLEVEGAAVPESEEKYRSTVGEGLDAVLPTIPSVDALVVVDAEGRVHYVSAGSAPDMGVEAPALAVVAGLDAPEREEVRLPSGELRTEVRAPILLGDGPGARRLGGVIVRYRPGVTDGTDAEGILTPWLTELARSMLREVDVTDDERRADDEVYRRRVSEGLQKVLRAFGGVDALIVVDRDGRIRYVSTPRDLDLRYSDPERLFASGVSRRTVELSSGEAGIERIVRVTDGRGEDERTLGAIVMRYRPDPSLAARLPQLSQPKVPPSAYTQPLILFLAATFGGGILLAALSGLPIRKLERALADFRERGFKGALDAKDAGLERDLGSAVRAINELGGKLQALDARGREREALLGTLSQSLEEGMVALDPSGTPVAWNPAAARMLTAPGDGGEADATADSRSVLAALERNPDLRFAVERAEAGASREIELVRGDGSKVPAQVTCVPFESRPGQSGTLLLFRDLATLRKVEGHLLEAGRFAVLAHLAAGLAHEIRNPLHSIRINASAAEHYVGTGTGAGGEGGRAVVESLETIKNETERLADLLNNYLGMVRPEKQSEWIDVRELCRRVVQLVGYTARKSHIEIRLDDDGDAALVRGVPDRLQQAILNLVLNAIQAMREGGVLSLRTERREDVVRVSVADTGPGLDDALADQLFDTRVTTKPEGSGLGLPLVRMIVEAHGGSVWYRSGPGRGATFTLVLPSGSGT